MSKDDKTPEEIEKDFAKCWDKLYAAQEDNNYKKIVKHTNKILELNNKFREVIGVKKTCSKLR